MPYQCWASRDAGLANKSNSASLRGHEQQLAALSIARNLDPSVWDNYVKVREGVTGRSPHQSLLY